MYGILQGLMEPMNREPFVFALKDLSVAGKKITLFEDGTDDRSFAIEENLLLSEDEMTLEIKCLPRGGFVAVIKLMSMRIYIFLLTVCFTFQMRAQQVPDWEKLLV